MNDRAKFDTELRDLEAAHFKAMQTIPDYLKGKASDVPYITHMRASFFETAQDIASQILTHSEDRETVERLARELYEQAGKYV